MDLRTDAAIVLACAFALSLAYAWYRATAEAGTSRHDSKRGFVQQVPLYLVATVVIVLLLAAPAWSARVGMTFAVGSIGASIGYDDPRIMLERDPGLLDWVGDLLFTGAPFVAARRRATARRGLRWGMTPTISDTGPEAAAPDVAGARIALDGTANTRDLGGWPLPAGGTTRYGRVWRSDAFTDATPTDRERLAMHRVRTVIDLRTANERSEAPHPLADDERFEVVHVDLFGPVVAGFLRGEVRGDPFDLLTHYVASFHLARDAYAHAFDVMARALDTHDGPVIVHCTAGKDRTGLVTALLLRAAGADTATIVAEYALTHERIEPLRPRLLDDGASKGLPRDAYARMLDAHAETMAAALEALDHELAELATNAARHLR